MRDIGKNIKSLRIKKNLTQDQFAEKLFVTRQTISNYETGRSRPDVDMLARIAEALETDVNALIYGPPTEADKKKEYLKTAIGVASILLLVLPLPWLKEIAEEISSYRFIMWPTYLLTCYYYPIVFFCVGWTVMQGLSLFTKLTPLPQGKTRWLILGCFVFMLFYFLMIASVYLPISNRPQILVYTVYFIWGVWPKGFAINWIYLFLPAGSLLWLGRLFYK